MNFHKFDLNYWNVYFKNLSIDSHDFLFDIEKNLKDVIQFVNRRDNSELPSYVVDEIFCRFYIYFQINLHKCSLKMKEAVLKKLVLANIRNLKSINIEGDTITLVSKDLYNYFDS